MLFRNDASAEGITSSTPSTFAAASASSAHTAPGDSSAAGSAAGLTPEEKLRRADLVRDKTGVTFEEARAALEASGYDALDAIVWLERRGKTARQTASYTTSGSAADAQAQEEMSRAQSDFEASTKPSGFSVAFGRFMDGVKRVLRRSVEISFVVSRRGARLFSVPLLLFIILAVFAFWVVIPLIIIGLFCEFRYSFDGIGKVTVDVNEWSRKASDGVDHLKRDVMDGYGDASKGDGASK